MPDTKGDANVVKSPKFKCFGHTWRLEVYPGGDDDANDGYVSAYLHNLSDEKITVDYQIAVLKADGKELNWKMRDNEKTFVQNQCWGWKNLVRRIILTTVR